MDVEISKVKLWLKDCILEIDEEEKSVKNKLSELECRKAELKLILNGLESKAMEWSKEIVSNNIKKHSGLKNLDSDDAKRINIFLEYIDKCGDETNSSKCRKIMPKLDYYIYSKKLWSNWAGYIEDLYKWINREGKWAGVLEKDKNI